MHHPGVGTHTHQRSIKKQKPVFWLVPIWKQNQDDPCEQSYVWKHWDNMSYSYNAEEDSSSNAPTDKMYTLLFLAGNRMIK